MFYLPHRMAQRWVMCIRAGERNILLWTKSPQKPLMFYGPKCHEEVEERGLRMEKC